MLAVINDRLKELLDTNDNPPELDALFRLRAALVWWMKGLIEPGDWSLRNYTAALVYPDVVTVLREAGFWKESGVIPLQVAGRSQPGAVPGSPRRAAKTRELHG